MKCKSESAGRKGSKNKGEVSYVEALTTLFADVLPPSTHSPKPKINRRKNSVNPKIHIPQDYAWRVLGWLTQDLGQFLTESELSVISKIIRKRSIEEYLKLSEDWGLQSISTGGAQLVNIRAKLQLAGLLKKYRFETEKDLREATAKKKFLDAEVSCGDFNREGWKSLGFSGTEWNIRCFTRMRSFLQKLLGPNLPDRTKLTEWSRHGPGATLDTEENLTSTYHKYSQWPYSCTEGALGHARLSIMDDSRWLGALEDSWRSHFNIPKWEILDQRVFWTTVFSVVPGNRVAFVPKNALTDRSIAIEPTMNLYLQLGVDGFIRRRLLRWGVDLDSQLKNNRLSRLGSLTPKEDLYDSFVTIDLSAASDTLSLKLCELLLPDAWYDYLIEIRSPMGDLDGECFMYNKISSMGNGYTFALESAIFAAVIYAVSMEDLGFYEPEDNAIFGDDLICRKSISESVVELLNLCGFTVNTEKSFFDGPVRESCGTDWFRGEPVRPVFFESAPSTVGELFTDLNRLVRLLSLRWGMEKSITARNMLRWVPEEFLLFGPRSDTTFDSYIHSDAPINCRRVRMLWEYKRLIYPPRPLVAREFLFRKLMHDLRPSQLCRPPWAKGQTGKGSRFVVTRRKTNITGYKYSRTEIWCDMYVEFDPSVQQPQLYSLLRKIDWMLRIGPDPSA